MMDRNQWPQAFGQSLWLDNITRELLDGGVLQQYINAWAISGLTSNPTIFDAAIAGSTAYDQAIRKGARGGQSDEALFMELALADLRRAADLLRPAFDATDGVDGWVSMEVSPTLADNAAATIGAALDVHRQAARPNLYVKIPGTATGLVAIEESVFQGVPVNVTLLFSRSQYQAAAEAYLRGAERRLAAGQDAPPGSVASVFVSRWDAAANPLVPPTMHNQLGLAVAGDIYRAYLDLLASPRWQRLALKGLKPQRLLWASTGTKDPKASDTLYVESLVAPNTINTLPEKTLQAFASHGQVRQVMAEDALQARAMLARFRAAGIDTDVLAEQLQRTGVQAFLNSWQHLMECVASKRLSAGKDGTR